MEIGDHEGIARTGNPEGFRLNRSRPDPKVKVIGQDDVIAPRMADDVRFSHLPELQVP